METYQVWQGFAVEVSSGTRSFETLRQRGDDVLIARVGRASGETVVCKFWNRRGWSGYWRSLTRTGTAWRECRALKTLHRHGVPVPQVLGLVELPQGKARHTVCLIVEDLGVCGDATEHLKGLIREGDVVGERAFNATIIETTAALVSCRLLDVDHRLPNYVVPPGKPPVRLDFELARRVCWRRLHERQYGVMLGTLLGSYCFAVQPDEQRMRDFAVQLVARLRPGKRILAIAGARIREMLARQRRESGIDTCFHPPWEA